MIVIVNSPTPFAFELDSGTDTTDPVLLVDFPSAGRAAAAFPTPADACGAIAPNTFLEFSAWGTYVCTPARRARRYTVLAINAVEDAS
jgi:hypothetical protein